MLPRTRRLNSSKELARVQKKGTRFLGAYLSVRFLPNPRFGGRAAVVVSSAVAKRATERNRAKRILRALLAQAALPAGDLVVTVRRLPEVDWFPAFRKDLERCWPA